jgi:histone H1/5
MSYKAGIIKAITELKDRSGSSQIAIKKHMQAALPADKKWMNATFLKAIKDGVTAGEFVQIKNSYKLSADAKKKAAGAGKKKAAPKKKVDGEKKTAPKKKSAPKKKAVSLLIDDMLHFSCAKLSYVMCHME